MIEPFTLAWPGSVVEYLDVLPLLVDAGFHCVIPSLPGFGWSGKPSEPGWGVARIAAAWAELMARLGYERYGAQGTDWGTSVSAALGRHGAVAGIHLMPPLTPTAAAQGDDDAGYSTQQRTRPQTVGYALTDSPAGLAAWIGEELDAWTDPRTPIAQHRILDTLMLYWLPRAAAPDPRRGRSALHGHPLLERARARRALPGARAAGGLRRRGHRVLRAHSRLIPHTRSTTSLVNAASSKNACGLPFEVSLNATCPASSVTL